MWAALTAALLFFQAPSPGGDGMKALEEGRYDAAAEAFQKAIQQDPSDYSAHFNLGLAYSLLARDSEGIAEYRKTLELKPGLYEAQLNLGILLLRQKNGADAAGLLSAAAARKPQEFRPRFYLAEAQLAADEAASAESNYRAALELDKKSAAATFGLARALARQDKLSDAALRFHEAAQLDANYRDGLLELAARYEAKEKTAEAIELYRQFPENPAAQEHLANLLLKSKQYTEALPQLEQAYASAPTQVNRVALAEAYLFTAQVGKALPLLEKAAVEEPDSYDLHLIYARALRDSKKYQPAAAQFQAALKIKPSVGQTWNELGGVLYLAEDYQGAMGAFERAGQLGENTAGNWFLRAIILDKFHQLKPALQAYEQFLALSGEKNPDQEFQARQRVRIIRRELEKR
jgi:tetratricopeptide (TPR) repeat protein